MAKRKEHIWSLNEVCHPGDPLYKGADITLTFTRKGIEVFGYFDHFVGIGPETTILWTEIDQIRHELQKKQ